MTRHFYYSVLSNERLIVSRVHLCKMDENESQVVNFERICRLCLHEKRILTEIFESAADNNNLTIDQKIMACATIDLCKDDGLPSRICIKCLTSVNAAFDFRIQCENADKTLHEIHTLLTSETDKEKEDSSLEISDSSATVKVVETTQTKKNERLDPEPICRTQPQVVGAKENWIQDVVPIHEFVETNFDLKNDKKNRKRMYLHGRTITSKVHRCESCDKTFSVRKSLVRHNFNCHGIETQKHRKVHECSVCLEVFNKWTELYEHQKTFGHHGKEKCIYCDKYFSRTYMIEHMRNHTGEKPFLCNLCGQSFGRISSFYKHKKLCSNAEKKFKCSFCDRRYYERYSLTEHERIHTNEKPFVCETCGKAFRRKGKLHIHQLSHKNLKPHMCTVCQRSFRQKGHLTEHLRIHSGVKPFTCDVCGAAFTQRHSLKNHKAKHPEVKIS